MMTVIRWSKYDDPVPGWELPASWALSDIEGDGDRWVDSNEPNVFVCVCVCVCVCLVCVCVFVFAFCYG